LNKSKILIVQSIGEFSGSLKSLEQYVGLMRDNFEFIFLTPRGMAHKRLKTYGKVEEVIGLSKFDNSQLGSYRGFRYLLLIREILLIIPTLLAIYKIKKKYKLIKLIHFNEITLLPTLFFFRLYYKIPFILHCRILFNNKNFFSKFINRFIKKNVSKIIAIDNDVKSSLDKSLPIIVIRNIIRLPKVTKKKFNTNKNLNIGYIGSFLKYKGLKDLILVHNNLRANGFKIKLILSGNYIVNENLILKLLDISNNINKSFIENSKHTLNLGHQDNLENFYNKIDVLCFPSYLNALGRQVFEASFFNVPSIVCIDKNRSDSFINKKTGLSFKQPGDLNQLKKLICYFYHNRKEVIKMGLKANKLVVKNFDTKKNLSKMSNLYLNLIKNSS
jgi:glycosyltransferase involved in cell wall biosynthesis